MKNSCMHAAIRELGTLFNEGAVGMLSDGQLLDRFVERRDASAFEAIVERYGPLVWGVCPASSGITTTPKTRSRQRFWSSPGRRLRSCRGRTRQLALRGGIPHGHERETTRAKRRVRERPAWEMTEPAAVPHEHADELLSRLDREVARLPEKYRLPIILCELEGKTHRQAAEQLGWPVGTVSGRLSRARAMLASRLSRRGTTLTVGALGALLAHDAARAGVPPELVRSTARAASLSTAGKAVAAGVVSAEVAALAGEVLKTMLINKLKLATAMLLVALALAAGGTSLTYRAHATEPANPKKRSGNPRERSNPAQEPSPSISGRQGPLPHRRRNRLAYRLPAGSLTSKAGRSPGSRCRSGRSAGPRAKTSTTGSRRSGGVRALDRLQVSGQRAFEQGRGQATTGHHRRPGPIPDRRHRSRAPRRSGDQRSNDRLHAMNVVTRRMESVAATGFRRSTARVLSQSTGPISFTPLRSDVPLRESCATRRRSSRWPTWKSGAITSPGATGAACRISGPPRMPRADSGWWVCPRARTTA